MGITTKSLALIMRGLEQADLPLQGLRMLELGNQHLYLDDRRIACHDAPARPWWQARGVEHVSVDLNGQDGAQDIDLCCRSLRNELVKRALPAEYDVVTNCGTLEHTRNACHALRNIRTVCRVGGLMIHNWPMQGHWPGHGNHYATLQTFRTLADICGDELLHAGTDFAMGNTSTGGEVQAIMRRGAGRTPSASVLAANVDLFAE